MRLTKLFIVATMLMVAINASATVVTYSDRAVWHTAITGGVIFEGFNNAFETPLTISTGGGYQSFWGSSSNPAVEGSHALGLIESAYATFNFADPVYAFGFDLIELNTGPLDYNDSNGASIQDLFVNDQVVNGNWTSHFYGFISDVGVSNFTIGVGTDSSGSVYFVDSLEYATASVPEPSALALIGLGLFGFAASRRKLAK